MLKKPGYLAKKQADKTWDTLIQNNISLQGCLAIVLNNPDIVDKMNEINPKLTEELHNGKKYLDDLTLLMRKQRG